MGLYTNIPHSEIETSIRHFIAKNTVLEIPPIDILISIVNHVPDNNVFEYDGSIYKQIYCTAMRTPMNTTIANLFMRWLEKKILRNSPITFAKWKRHIQPSRLLIHVVGSMYPFLMFLLQLMG